MSKVGRNDPCPCGSGKKYKKCCLNREYEQRQQAAGEQRRMDEGGYSRPAAAEETYSDEEVQEREWWDEFMSEFEEAEPDEIPGLAERALQEAPRFDGEDAITTAQRVKEVLLEQGRAAEFLKFLDSVRHLRPEAYKVEGRWFGMWRVQVARRHGQGDLAEAVNEATEDVMDILALVRPQVLDSLLYEGHGDVLAAVLPRVWNQLVENKGELMDFVLPEYSEFAAGMLAAWSIHKEPDLVTPGPALLAALEGVGYEERGLLPSELACRAGLESALWGEELDSTLETPEEQSRHLRGLCLEFGRSLVTDHGWHPLKAELATQSWYTFSFGQMRGVGGQKRLLTTTERARILIPYRLRVEGYLGLNQAQTKALFA